MDAHHAPEIPHHLVSHDRRVRRLRLPQLAVVAVILALHLFGHEVIVLQIGHPSHDTDHEDESPGDCTTYPVGFTARPELPDEVGLPDRDW